MKEKGIDELLAAFSKLKKEESVILDMVGPIEDMQYQEKIDKLVALKEIHYYGFQEDVKSYIKKCHCVVLPSYHEGMANVLLEAGSMGRPLIASKIYGCKEAINGKNGMTIKCRDVEDLYNIVKKLYSAIFNNIIYIEQGNIKKFNNGLEMDEFINYFLSVQRSVLNASFMRQLWELKICTNIDKFAGFFYEIDKLYITKDNSLIKSWCCFCEILLYGLRENDLDSKYVNYKLAIYSILMKLVKNPDYTNAYLNEVIKNIDNPGNMYFVWNQFKYMSLKKRAAFNKETALLHDKIYEKAYQFFKDKLNDCLVKIPISKRNKNLVLITTIQFLNGTHAPTKTVLERAKALKKLGKDVVIVNTTEQYIIKGYLPMYNSYFGTVLGEYDNIKEIKLGEDRFPFFQMPENSPVEYRLQVLSELLAKYKPYYILSIGTGSILADA